MQSRGTQDCPPLYFLGQADPRCKPKVGDAIARPSGFGKTGFGKIGGAFRELDEGARRPVDEYDRKLAAPHHEGERHYKPVAESRWFSATLFRKG
jgi:hypothetical protein